MKCSDCKWFDDEHEKVKHLPGCFGLCRKHKPLVRAQENLFYGEWPLVDKDDFCGEFRRIE